MSLLTRFKFFLWYFGHFKVAMIGFLRPRIMQLDDKNIVIRIRLNHRSRNHLKSMYFGALSVGADLAGGLHGFYHAKLAKRKASIAFKSFQAQFIKRPESDVYFVCTSGDEVKQMIAESQKTGERINKMLPIKAYINYYQQAEEVANFSLELSLKVIS